MVGMEVRRGWDGGLGWLSFELKILTFKKG